MNYAKSKLIVEEAPTNSAGTGAVAGIGVGPDGEPGRPVGYMKRKRRKIVRRILNQMGFRK